MLKVQPYNDKWRDVVHAYESTHYGNRSRHDDRTQLLTWCELPIGYYRILVSASQGKIDQFVIAPHVRRRKLGTWLMNSLVVKWCELRSLTIKVHEYNLAGQLFLQRHKFIMKRTLPSPVEGTADYLFILEPQRVPYSRRLQAGLNGHGLVAPVGCEAHDGGAPDGGGVHPPL